MKAKLLRALAVLILLITLVIAPALPAQAATIDMSSFTGKVAEQIAITGAGFTAAATYTITFFNTTFSSVQVASGVVAGGGTFSTIFAIPQRPRAAYTVRASDGTNLVDATFNVIPSVSLNKTQDVVGASFQVSGNGFGASGTVAILFDDVQISSALADSLGTFANASVTVPESSRSAHTIRVRDAGGFSDTATFTTLQSFAISPLTGKVNDTVTITAKGFRGAVPLTITFGDTTVLTPQTQTSGSFSGIFKVPPVASGAYTVKASDGTNESTTNFSVQATATIGNTNVRPGAQITASGNGFIASKTVNITLDGNKIGTVDTDSTGAFSTSITIPPTIAGAHTLNINDGVNAFQFSITVTVIMNIDKVLANVGSEVTVRGSGFLGSISIKYDDTEFTKINAAADGSFQYTFKVPPSKSGPHRITASDSANSVQTSLVMEAIAPPIPQPLLPQMGVKSKASVPFEWGTVTDDSAPVTYTLQVATDSAFKNIILEKKNLTVTQYTLTEAEKLPSVKKANPYYWHVRATDAAQNVSDWSGAGTFYVGFVLDLPPWVLYASIGAGALLLLLIGVFIGRRTARY